MTDLNVQKIMIGRNPTLVVDSRLIAERLGIEHINFMEAIGDYQTQTEQAFGIVRFETEKLGGRGRPQKYALLTEDQAIFLMTLSRNTSEVVQCKIDLVVAFSRAKEFLKSGTPVELPKLAPPIERIASLKASLEFFGIDMENPRFRQSMQDLTLDVLGVSGPAIEGSTEAWCGVAERAEQLGYAAGRVSDSRSQLGKAVKRVLPESDRRQEFRLCNGTQRNVNLYLVTDSLDAAICNYFEELEDVS